VIFYRGFFTGIFDARRFCSRQSNKASVFAWRNQTSRLEAVQTHVTSVGNQIRPSIATVAQLGITKLLMAKVVSVIINFTSDELCLSAAIIWPFTKELINFTDSNKAAQLESALKNYIVSLNRERFTATIESITPDGFEDVFDIQVPA